MGGEDHGAGPIRYPVAGVCCDIIKELVNSCCGVLSSLCLLGADGTEGSKELVINSAGIIEEGTNDALYSFDTRIVEGGGCVEVGEELFFSAIYNLTVTGSRSRAGAHIFLSEDDPIPRDNGPVLSISQILKFVLASVAEAELAALYTTAREMIPLRNALDEMGWKQPRWPIQTDNSAASGFISDTIIQRRIKMIWMRLHWLR